MSFTLATLKSAIQDYADNAETSFVTNLPNFIKAAEEKIFKSVDLDYFRKNVTSAFTSSDAFLTVPSDYLASFSLQITTSGSESFLLQKDVNFLREYTPSSSTTGLPKYYALTVVGPAVARLPPPTIPPIVAVSPLAVNVYVSEVTTVML